MFIVSYLNISDLIPTGRMPLHLGRNWFLINLYSFLQIFLYQPPPPRPRASEHFVLFSFIYPHTRGHARNRLHSWSRWRVEASRRKESWDYTRDSDKELNSDLLDFRRADLSSSEICLEESHETRPCREEGPKKAVNIQGSSPSSRAAHPKNPEKKARRHKWMDNDLLAKSSHKKEECRRWKQEQVTWEDCRNIIQAHRYRTAKAQLKMDLVSDVIGKKNGFCKWMEDRRKCGPIAQWDEELGYAVQER